MHHKHVEYQLFFHLITQNICIDCAKLMVCFIKVQILCSYRTLNPNLGGLFRGLFEVCGGKISPCLKLVRIMSET